MDVLVCGAQAPFTRGGAEMAQENIVTALREAGHRAELVRVPVAWEKGRIFDSATAWRSIPLDADLVIATNFPSYFARHDNKVVWLFHQHRAAYDALGAAWSDLGEDDTSLETQRLLAEWDCRALGEARMIFTLSEVVVNRLARYNGLDSRTLYHPPPLADRLRVGEYGDYLFCPSRLEQNKRPSRVVAALPGSGDLRAVLAGTGSLKDSLLRQAADAGVADRVELAGFVSDDDLIDLFANCLAVVYAPHEEDYGYVTLQAFLAGRPVITTDDSGGVLEWVRDGENGFVTDGSDQALQEATARLHEDRELARRMGQEGRRLVESLSWSSVVETLTRGY
ncbi:MAG: glycosyltransferase family 4 protein [Actinomycetales bacterium]